MAMRVGTPARARLPGADGPPLRAACRRRRQRAATRNRRGRAPGPPAPARALPPPAPSGVVLGLVEPPGAGGQLQGLCSLAAAAALLYAALPLLAAREGEDAGDAAGAAPAAPRRRAAAREVDEEADEADRVAEWRLMGFVSLVPLGYWTAWLLPAVLDAADGGGGARAGREGTRYLPLALLYSLPLLLSGGQLYGGATATALLLCAAHVQVERLKDDAGLSSAATGAPPGRAALGGAREAVGRLLAGGGGAAGGDVLDEARRRREDEDAEELERFDRELLGDDAEADPERDRGGW